MIEVETIEDKGRIDNSSEKADEVDRIIETNIKKLDEFLEEDLWHAYPKIFIEEKQYFKKKINFWYLKMFLYMRPILEDKGNHLFLLYRVNSSIPYSFKIDSPF